MFECWWCVGSGGGEGRGGVCTAMRNPQVRTDVQSLSHGAIKTSEFGDG